MKVAKHLTVRQLNKQAPFNDKDKYPNGLTYPDGTVPTPGTWAATLLKLLEYYFGPSSYEEENDKQPKPRKGNLVTFSP